MGAVNVLWRRRILQLPECLLIADPVGEVVGEARWVGGLSLLGDLVVVLEFVDQDGHGAADCAFDQSDLVERVRESDAALDEPGCDPFWVFVKARVASIHWARWVAPWGSRLLSPTTASLFCSQ